MTVRQQDGEGFLVRWTRGMTTSSGEPWKFLLALAVLALVNLPVSTTGTGLVPAIWIALILGPQPRPAVRSAGEMTP